MTTPTKFETCGNCKWAQTRIKKDGEVEFGLRDCHRFPAEPMQFPTPDGRSIELRFIYVVVGLTDWCGEFAPHVPSRSETH